MKTLVAHGTTLETIAPAEGYSSGQPVVIGSLVGISCNNYAPEEIAIIQITGAHMVAKDEEIWKVGQLIYWNDQKKIFTTTATNNTVAGYAWRNADESEATGIILLR